MANDLPTDTENSEKETKRPTTDAKTFIKVWQTSPSVKKVCDELGLLPSSASQRATNLRKRGVDLKKMPRNSHGFDIEELQALAREYSDSDAPASVD